MSINNDKLYTKHDLEQIQRITIVEQKIDHLTDTFNTKCDSINDTLKTIRAHQTKSLTFKDILSYSKKNYKAIGILLLIVMGGDTLRGQIFNMFVNSFSLNNSKAQDIGNALNK